MTNGIKKNKVTVGAMFALASVWFGTNVGGGFATGNQSLQYYVNYGWYSIVSSLITTLLLWLTMREAVIMTNARGLKNYKELFCELYAPYTKMELTFEFFYYVMILSAVGGAIAGAAQLITNFNLPYQLCVLIVGIILLLLTVFGAQPVIRASAFMSVCIIVSLTIICFVAINMRLDNLSAIIGEKQTSGSVFQAVKGAAYLGGAMCLSIPGVTSCAGALKNKRSINISLFMGFVMLSLISCFTCWMLLAWHKDILAAEETALPILYVCRQTNSTLLYMLYFVSLMCAFISTGVSAIFGLVARLENSFFKNTTAGIFADIKYRRILISVLSMALCMGVSLVGLSNIVKYAYTYMGIWSIIFIMLPFLTIGHIKNKKYVEEHPEFLG